MYQLTDEGDGNVIEIRATGLLSEADYNRLLPRLRAAIAEHDLIRVLLEKEVEGIEPEALWDEIVFDLGQLHHVERLAVVGDATWEKVLDKLAAPFVEAETCFFEHDQKRRARQWLQER
jgi:hypothetical protein